VAPTPSHAPAATIPANPNGGTLALTMPAELIEQIARRAAELVAERKSPAVSPWLSVAEAAERLRCGKDRIYDLIALGKLTPRRDGRRVLLRRDDLDAYVEASA